MHRHPWISAFFGVGSNLAMLVMIILVSWTRFLTGDSSTRSTRTEEAEDQAEDSDNMDTASRDQDAGTNVPVVRPARASRGISKLYEITSELVRDFITSDEVRKVVEIYIVT